MDPQLRLLLEVAYEAFENGELSWAFPTTGTLYLIQDCRSGMEYRKPERERHVSVYRVV